MSQTHNRPLIIFILGALSTISPFAIDMYLPAFPEMATALHTTTARISLSLASYFAGLAAGQLIYGPLLDRFGRKLPLYAGVMLFVAASLACLFSRNVEWLVGWRFVQAVGGCAAGVAAMAMVRDFFPARETAKIISLLILVISASPLLAPSVGVFVAVHLGWQWVFIVLSAFVLLMLAVTAFVLSEGHEPDRSVELRRCPSCATTPPCSKTRNSSPTRWRYPLPFPACSSMWPARRLSSWKSSMSARSNSAPSSRVYPSVSSAPTR